MPTSIILGQAQIHLAVMQSTNVLILMISIGDPEVHVAILMKLQVLSIARYQSDFVLVN